MAVTSGLFRVAWFQLRKGVPNTVRLGFILIEGNRSDGNFSLKVAHSIGYALWLGHTIFDD